MNLRSIDLNLLVVLGTLLDERHVTRAATRLGITQSAASSALDRCRDLFHDRLLIRVGKGLQLTRRAQTLQQPLREILSDIGGLMSQPVSTLSTLDTTVRIGMADAMIAAVIAPLHAHLTKTAPRIRIAFTPWRGTFAMTQQLEQGELDLVLSLLPAMPGQFRHQEVVRQEYVVAMRRDHPASDDFNLDSWLAYPHVLVSSAGELKGALDDALQALGRTREAAIAVPSFLAVFSLIEQSDIIAMVPELCYCDPQDRLKAFLPPIPVDGFSLYLTWHQRHDLDLAVQHVAKALAEQVRRVSAERAHSGHC